MHEEGSIVEVNNGLVIRLTRSALGDKYILIRMHVKHTPLQTQAIAKHNEMESQ